MKKKILLSLSGFVVLCIAIGAISIFKKPTSNITSNIDQSNVVPDMAMDVEIPSCQDETGAVVDCFPIINGVDSSAQSADIALAWRKSGYLSYNYKKPTSTQTTKPTTSTTTPTTTTPTTPPTTTQTVITNKEWGAFLPNGSPSDVTTLESQVGAPMDIRAVFVGWGNGASDFPSWLTSTLKGKTLLMYWEPAANGTTGNVNQPSYNYDSIISGKWDTSIVAFAKAVKSYGGPVILIPFDEMNGDWYPWSGTNNGNSPAKHNAAYQHLHDLFAAQGVTNVKWGWAPNNESWPNTTANDLTAYYPGDAYVDYVGVDGFNFNDPWISYNQIFDKALAKLAQYNKPIYIFSMASAEANDGGAKKAAWIADAFAQIAKNPKIKGWIWFNENKERNWLMNSSSATLTAIKQIVTMF